MNTLRKHISESSSSRPARLTTLRSLSVWAALGLVAVAGCTDEPFDSGTTTESLDHDSIDCTDFPTENDPNLGEIHVVEGVTIEGDLTVPAGVHCQLRDSTVEGDLKAEDHAMGASVFYGSRIEGDFKLGESATAALFESSVGGDYTCNGCDFRNARFSDVGGDLVVSGGFHPEGSEILDTSIGGDIKVSGGDFAFAFSVEGTTTIGGDVRFDGNRGGIQILPSDSGPVEEGVRVVVEGDVKIEHSEAIVVVAETSIGGHLKVENCEIFDVAVIIGGQVVFSSSTQILANEINGDLTFDGNSAVAGPTIDFVYPPFVAFSLGTAEIADNTIEGVLSCGGNDPAPTGEGNAASEKQGQCEAL